VHYRNLNTENLESGYRWFGNNRKVISRRRAWRSSGSDTKHFFDVAVVSDKVEGILWVQLIHRVNMSSFGICACYLPPIAQEEIDPMNSLTA
jgi:hypothetical protein